MYFSNLCYSYGAIDYIVNEMRKELDKASKIDFATEWIKKYIARNISYESIYLTRDKIGDELYSHFKHLKYALAVYPPLWGFDNHCTDFDIPLFRHFDKNIALTFKPGTYNSKCKDMDLTTTLNNPMDAEKLFDELKKYYAWSGENHKIIVHRNKYAWHWLASKNGLCTVEYSRDTGICEGPKFHGRCRKTRKILQLTAMIF